MPGLIAHRSYSAKIYFSTCAIVNRKSRQSGVRLALGFRMIPAKCLQVSDVSPVTLTSVEHLRFHNSNRYHIGEMKQAEDILMTGEPLRRAI